ncbi:MAG: glutathione S-transferase N-terminal domain-containing protein [Alphaproteobacteria bacterium]|nr:glutathione S-transferase N-terminal domain-containing protein [Alphaproteobacteria bacterium]
MITLYDLVFAGDARPSPFCWRAKFALAHKGLKWKEVTVGFTEKDKIAFSGQGLVPVIVDHAHADKEVHDSWDIALYLDQAYPEKPLLKSEHARAFARFVHNWTATTVQAGMFPLMVADMYARVRPQDRDYFRESRGKRLGTEDFDSFQAKARETRLVPFRQSLDTMRLQLKAAPFLSGGRAAYPDYIVAGAFLWARSVTPFALLEAGDPIAAWLDRMLGLYGFGERLKAAA